jgi:hypothetical protein
MMRLLFPLLVGWFIAFVNYPGLRLNVRRGSNGSGVLLVSGSVQYFCGTKVWSEIGGRT